MNTHQETIEHARADFLRSKERLSSALSTTPDDRINWSPSPTARTPIQQVAHAAQVLEGMQIMLNGGTFPIETSAEADKVFLEQEKPFTTRESVLHLLEQNSATYLQWLDSLTPEALTATVTLPFGFGTAPMTAALSFASQHTNWHTAQINYIQTIYGDRVWH